MTACTLFYFKHSENDSDERGEEKKKTGRHVRERKQGNKKKERKSFKISNSKRPKPL